MKPKKMNPSPFEKLGRNLYYGLLVWVSSCLTLYYDKKNNDKKADHHLEKSQTYLEKMYK